MKYAIVYICPIVFVDFMKNGTDAISVVRNKLPDDAVLIRHFAHDPTGWGRIGLVIESESFMDIKENETIPLLPDPQFSKNYDSR